ncbi:MAG: selenide, water dikinase SelD, partial [Phycisphaerales bacterium]|nr:selenide, water dikinase SelD [Phycisphaerales bacterium]
MVQVLRQLEPMTHPDLLVGSETFDDAGVFRLSEDLALVQTTDFFPPLVDDPYDFGRIAAANALSDVYAMGGEPLTCLNIVGFPDKELPPEVLVDILRGGAAVAREAGAVIVGGHSVRDAEVKYGMAVTGRVHPRRVLTNAGARPGDRLVLTKPLGSGVLCSAVKSGRMDASELAEAVSVMTALNKAGRDAAVAVGVHACTDVTGFGLIGHAFEMAEA